MAKIFSRILDKVITVREIDTKAREIKGWPHHKSYLYVCRFWLQPNENADHSIPGAEFGFNGYCVVQPNENEKPMVYKNIEEVKKAFPSYSLGFELD